jgi:hypothetical protein
MMIKKDRVIAMLTNKSRHRSRVHPVDELAGLRQFLEKLESGYLRLRRNQIDVTKSEVDVLKLEITHLERILGRTKLLAQNGPSGFNESTNEGPTSIMPA